MAFSRDAEIEQRLKEVQETGISLLTPPSSTEELLMLLDKSDNLMKKMEQSSSEPTKQALFPMMRALKSHELIRSSVMDVKMTVLCCISEMIRITAPHPPYNDDVLKEFFHMLVPAFASLSETPNSRIYGKAASILEIAAEVRFCLLMLDLELDNLVIEMIQLFLKIIRSNHPNAIFKHMESVMTMMVEESEDVSLELLSSLLASVRKENQNLSPASWKLGERVLKNCAAKLKPCMKKAVHSSEVFLDGYSQIVTSIWKSGSVSDEDQIGGSGELVLQAEENNSEIRADQDQQSPITLAQENNVENRTNQDDQFLVTRADDYNSENRTGRDEQSLVTKISALDDGVPNETGQAVDGITKSTKQNDSSPSRVDGTIVNKNSPKQLEPCHLNMISRSAGADDNAEVDKLDSTMVQEIDPETVPEKRKWKANSKTLTDEGYSHYRGSTEKKSRSRKSREEGVGPSHSSRKVSCPSTQDQVAAPPVFSPKVGEIKGASSLSQNGSLPEGSSRRRGRPKKNRIMLNENGDSCTQVSKVDFCTDQVNEETLKSGEIKGASSLSQNGSLPEGSSRRRGRPKKNRIMLNENGDSCTQVSKVDSCTDQVNEETLKYADIHVKKEPDDSSCLEPRQVMSVKDEIPVKDTLKRKRKRKLTAAKGEASLMSDFDEQLLGKNIKVWWPLDKQFYAGVIKSYDNKKKKHKVLYTDGVEEILNLKKERWELIGNDVSLDGEPEADLPKHDASSHITLKRRRNRKSGSSGQAKASSSSKRGRPAKKLKVEVDSEPLNPVIDEQVNGQKSTGTGSGSKPTTPEPGDEAVIPAEVPAPALGAKAIERHAAQFRVLAEDCDQADYVQLVKALRADHNENSITVPIAKSNGELSGLCKIDSEGKARKDVGCSCLVVGRTQRNSTLCSSILRRKLRCNETCFYCVQFAANSFESDSYVLNMSGLTVPVVKKEDN